jgi:hypothetical protein
VVVAGALRIRFRTPKPAPTSALSAPIADIDKATTPAPTLRR